MQRFIFFTLALLLSFTPAFLASPAQALSKTQVTLKASSGALRVGQTVTLTTKVLAASAGNRVIFQKKINGVWSQLANKPLNTSKVATLRTTIKNANNYYRVVFVKTSKFAQSVSPTVYVKGTVNNPPPPPVDKTLSGYTLNQLRTDLSLKINAYRDQRGLNPLIMTVDLNNIAQDWSSTQKSNNAVSENQFLSSSSPEGYALKDEFVTLNKLPQDVMNFLVSQEPQLLLTDVQYLGIGMILKDSSTGYWTIDLATDSSTVPPVNGWTVGEARSIILKDTNDFRQSQGMPPLAGYAEIDNIAQDWSQHMADSNTFEHSPDYLDRIPAGWRDAAENIAAGYAPDTVVQGWIDSPGHRANMLGEFTHIGIGYGTNDSSTYKTYYTQDFATY